MLRPLSYTDESGRTRKTEVWIYLAGPDDSPVRGRPGGERGLARGRLGATLIQKRVREGGMEKVMVRLRRLLYLLRIVVDSASWGRG